MSGLLGPDELIDTFEAVRTASMRSRFGIDLDRLIRPPFAAKRVCLSR